MMCLLILALLWGFCCAIIGVAAVSVFGTDDSPLRWYFRWASEWQDCGGWRSWITSPIGGCVLCTSGQLALWSHFAYVPSIFFLDILAGCSAVLFAVAINGAYKWMRNQI